MGTVIAIDFKRRGRARACEVKQAPHGLAGGIGEVAGCLACLYAPLLLYWTVWLSLACRREGSHDAVPDGGADGR